MMIEKNRGSIFACPIWYIEKSAMTRFVCHSHFYFPKIGVPVLCFVSVLFAFFSLRRFAIAQAMLAVGIVYSTGLYAEALCERKIYGRK